MTQTAIRLTTKVLPGKRIDVTAPELIVLQPEPVSVPEAPQGVWDWLQTLAPAQRTAEQWAAIEREFQEERVCEPSTAC